MSNQIVISSGAKVRNLNGVLTGTTGVVNSLGINVANGIPQLDGSGKILVSQLPNSVMEYKGTWNAATNTPTLANGTGNQGDVYLVSVAGTTNFGAGPITFAVGDQTIYSGTIWQKAGGSTGTVTSVSVTESGDALSITGSPITTSGTINIGFNGTSGQYVNGAGGLTTFPSLTGYVPYTGATANVNLGAFDLFTSKLWLYDAPNDGYGSIHLADGSMHFEDADGHTMFDIEDGFIQIHKDASIQSNLFVTDLTATRDHYLPNASGTLALTSDLSGYVPYTGATADVNLGTYDLTTDIATLNQVKAVGSGGISFNANSGTQVAAMGSGGGANMTLYGGLNGTSASFSSSITGNTIVKSGGTSSQFLKADGSIDSNTYLTTSGASSTYVDLTSNQTIAGIKTFSNTIVANDSVYFAAAGTAVPTIIKNISGTGLVSTGANGLGFNSNNDLYFSGTAKYGGIFSFTNTQINTYTLQNSSGTIAFTGDLHNPVTIGTANGLSLSTQVLSLALATTSTNGALSSTDWNTFNGKQAALSGTGFVKISGTTISYDNSTYLTTSSASSTYLPLTGGSLSGQLSILRGSGTGLDVASDSVIFRGNTGIGSPRQLVFSSGGGPTTLIEAKGYGASYNTDLSLKTYNSSGTGFDVFFATSAGDVGIGTTAPLSRLQVVATGTILRLGEASGSTGKQLLFGIDAASGRSEIQSVWQGTSNTPLALNPAGGNVGIGNTAPSEKLDVNGSIKISGTNSTIKTSVNSSLAMQLNNATANDFQLNGAGPFRVINQAYNSVLMQVNNNGNVGIATASPSTILDIVGTFRTRRPADTTQYVDVYSNGGEGYIDAVNSAAGTSQALVFRNGNSGGTTERMRITSNGNVGIGITTPTQPLHVYSASTTTSSYFETNSANSYIGLKSTSGVCFIGNVGHALSFEAGGAERLRIASSGAANFTSSVTTTQAVINSGASNNFINFIQNSTNIGYVGDANWIFGGSISDFGVRATNNLVFGIGASERMRITSGGNVLIGTTTDNGSKLQVSGNVAVGNTTNSNAAYVTFNNNQNGYRFGVNGACTQWEYTNGGISVVATVNGATGVYTALSDINHKKDFELSQLGLKAILGLKPTLYRMKSEENTKKHLGFIAQEVKEFIPEAFVEKDSFIGLNEMPIIATLVKAVQELNTKIEQLKNK